MELEIIASLVDYTIAFAARFVQLGDVFFWIFGF